MDIVKNPSDAEIKALCDASPHNAAKWIRDVRTGDMYYAAVGEFFHAQIAEAVGVAEYEKGLAVPGE